MKRIALLVLFFYCCTFTNPQQSHATVPLALVAASVIGTSLLATSAGTFYAKKDVSTSYVPAASTGSASASDYLYQSSWRALGPIALVTAQSFPHVAQMYAAKDAAIGAKLGDVLDYVSSHPTTFSALETIVASCQTPAPLFTSIAVPTGGIVSLTDGSKIIVGNLIATRNMNYYVDGFDSYMSSVGIKINGWAHAYYSPSQHQIYALSSEYCQTYQGITYYWVYNYSATSTTSEPTLNPQTLPDYASLKDKLVNPSVDVAKDIRDVIKALPDSKLVKAGEVPTAQTAATQAPTITQAELNDILKANTAAVAQAAAEAAATAAAANPTDAAAAATAAQTALDAAKALEEANKADDTPAAETFSSLSDSPFGTAYNPGSFDIKTRFTTFLSNVKTSGLFSFSSAFFDSLPGGGTPLLTVDGGHTFGTHTFDFSQSFSGGLSILKSVLLALFGFLSVRAVIMKR